MIWQQSLDYTPVNSSFIGHKIQPQQLVSNESMKRQCICLIDGLYRRALAVDNLDNRSDADDRNNLNNKARLVGIVQANAGLL